MPGETIWLFGLPCSGKTTLAEGLIGPNTVHLDGDYLRETLNADLGFSKADRTENLRRAAGVAQAMNDQGLDVVASFITPYRSQRELIAETVDDVSFVHVSAPLEVCEERDVKGMYERARAGDIDGFTGIDAPFEEPSEAEPGFEVRTSTRSRSDGTSDTRSSRSPMLSKRSAGQRRASSTRRTNSSRGSISMSDRHRRGVRS